MILRGGRGRLNNRQKDFIRNKFRQVIFGKLRNLKKVFFKSMTWYDNYMPLIFKFILATCMDFKYFLLTWAINRITISNYAQ